MQMGSGFIDSHRTGAGSLTPAVVHLPTGWQRVVGVNR
jgi:hypothetical protein